MKEQYHIYSIDTSAFYTEEENKIQRRLNKAYLYRKLLKKSNKDVSKHKKYINERINKLKAELRQLFVANKDVVRELNPEALQHKNIVSLFESTFSRVLGIKNGTVSEDVIIIQVYFQQVLENLIKHGFIHNGEKYKIFSASAGQIRTKKVVFVKESLINKHINTLSCGLSVEKINALGGVNVNKYLAYLALNNSATEKYDRINLDKTIVVDDMETYVNALVDFIDEKTFNISREQRDILINHTDGCGMMLPKVSKKCFMIRLPWIKGLLVPFSFDTFCRQHGVSKVKDIWGKEWDILEDDIEVILTKSQIKMWKYYESWQEYKDNFKKYNCQVGICNKEEDYFNDARLNYQMLQTLTDISDEELEQISKVTNETIVNVATDRETMLRILGATESNPDKSYFQQALVIYPELLADAFSKETLKQVKGKLIDEAKAGKLNINGKYTFIIPDLYAFCQYHFLGERKPKGLLADGEVFCNMYKNEPKLNCLRSPHLYREWAIRKNVWDKEKRKWFITDGVYVSTHDAISRLLQFDCDGDKSLVCADKTLLEVSERNMQGIVPLYYEMASATKELLTPETIFEGLKNAYNGGNIGVISNHISKIWNSDSVNLNVIKWLCMENNFVIDYAKTLYKVKRPKEVCKEITKYTKSKVPHFFIYAKEKEKNQVEEINNSTVNRLEYIIKDKRLNFTANVGKFDFKMLMSAKNVEFDQLVIEKYEEMDKQKRWMLKADDKKENNIAYVYRKIRDEILAVNNDVDYVVNVLVDYLYNHKKSSHKETLWQCFGAEIVENLMRNVEKKFRGANKFCECGKRFKPTNNRQKKCTACAERDIKERDRKRKSIFRKVV